MTSEEPGISVSAPATSPPVQDSAVAMVSLRLRHRSSSERARARASLPLILIAPTFIAPIFIAPRETDGGARHRGDASLAAGESKPLAGGRLHRHARQIQAGDVRDPRAHDIPKRSDLRSLADHRHVEMSDAAAARGHAIDGVFQKPMRGGALPSWIARRKMRTDIAIRQRAEDRVDQRVQADIAVGMRQKTFAVRHAHAADHHMIAVAERMHVVAGAGPYIAEHGAEA